LPTPTIISARRPTSHPRVFTAVIATLALIVAFGARNVAAQEPAEVTDTTAIVEAALTPPAPPANILADDAPNDAGGAIIVRWDKSPDEGAGLDNVGAYQLLRGRSPNGPFDTVGTMTAGMTEFNDGDVEDGIDYYYVVEVIALPSPDHPNVEPPVSISRPSQPARSSAQWIHMGRLNSLLAVVILASSILYFISKAKGGEKLFIRKIAGLEAVDEAVGRATEMGRKIFFIPGIQDMNNVQTIAGVTILGRVAKMAATYDAKLDVPVPRSLVMVAARETVKQAYLDAGRPDAYDEDMVHYLTDDQFGYAAGVDGMFVRQKPATIFYMGAFFAESLILAETGNSIGAIQIAGTAMPAQLPFFVAACDYTLIGEELFAASAYLSREPKQLGSLKGQDVGKFFILLFAIGGILLATFGVYNISHWFLVR